MFFTHMIDDETEEEEDEGAGIPEDALDEIAEEAEDPETEALTVELPVEEDDGEEEDDDDDLLEEDAEDVDFDTHDDVDHI